jgi:fumarate reductase subunit C
MLYALLILAVVPHAAIGLYRLAVKWGVLPSRDPERGRRRARAGAWALIIVFILLSFLALGQFVRVGLEHPRTADTPPAATHQTRSGP